MKWLVLPLVAILVTAVQAHTIYRWVDEHGQVHLADSVPERYKSSAVRIDGRINKEMSANRVQAHAPAGDSSGDCAALYQAYRRSQECFAPYVQANGSVKAEAYERCGAAVVDPSPKCGPALSQ